MTDSAPPADPCPAPAPSPRRPLLPRRLLGGASVLCTVFAALGTRPGGAGPGGAAPPGPRRPPLLMIDPGHGGRDPGARGQAGTLEKDVTLTTALALRAALRRGGYERIEMTRAEDRFMTPEGRASRAREQGADLFLSLHADTYPVASVHGASVYTLAQRASDPESEALAARENGARGADRAGAPRFPPEVTDILGSLAARETRARSARVARRLVRDLARDIPVLPSPARHANFTVLQAAGIPSVLIEMGFLSNPDDETALNDDAHRERLARAIVRAVDGWFASPDAGREGA